LGDYDAAKSAFDKAISSATSSLAEAVLAPMYMYKVALVEIELGNNGDAKNRLEEIVSEYPKSQQKNSAEALAASLASN
jgi:TolA-binding protein